MGELTCYSPVRDVNKATGVKAKANVTDPRSQTQGQDHRPKAKVENAKVNFRLNATVNPFFQFRVIFANL